MQSMSAWPAPIILYASEKYLPIGTLLIPSVSLYHDPETNGNNKAYTDAFHRAERSLLICPPPQESAPKRDSRSPKYQHLPFPYEAYRQTATSATYHITQDSRRTSVSAALAATPRFSCTSVVIVPDSLTFGCLYRSLPSATTFDQHPKMLAFSIRHASILTRTRSSPSMSTLSAGRISINLIESSRVPYLWYAIKFASPYEDMGNQMTGFFPSETC